MTTTNTADVQLLSMIATCAELWARTLPLDARAVQMHSAGQYAESSELDRQRGQLVDEACALERRILRTRARTAEGRAAKAAFNHALVK